MAKYRTNLDGDEKLDLWGESPKAEREAAEPLQLGQSAYEHNKPVYEAEGYLY